MTTEMKVLYKKRQKIHVFNLSTSAWVDTHRHLHCVGSPPADQSLPPLLRSHVGCCVFAAVYTWRQAWEGRGALLKDEASCTNTLSFLWCLKRRHPDSEPLMLISVTNLSLFLPLVYAIRCLSRWAASCKWRQFVPLLKWLFNGMEWLYETMKSFSTSRFFNCSTSQIPALWCH